MNQSGKTGILVGASPLGAEAGNLLTILKERNCVTVAADGGLSFFVKNKIRPDYFFGDGDSLDEVVAAEARKLFPELELNFCAREKDDTDMRLGMLKCRKEGVSEVYIFGGIGGERMDHTFANTALIHEFSEEGISCYLVGEKETFYVLTKGQSVSYPEECSGIVSVFSLTPECNLSIKGLHYEFEGSLSGKSSIGVSNECCGKKGLITVNDGAALIISQVPFFYNRICK